MSACKVFSSAEVDDDLTRFESMVDDWLRERQPRILALAQSALGSHLVLSLVYDTEDETAETMVGVEAAEVPEVFERTMEQTNLDPSTSSNELLPEAELPY